MATEEIPMKPILMVHNHPEIERFQEETEQKITFISKQIKDLEMKKDEMISEFWNNLHDYMKQNNILKNPEKTRLLFRDGVIYKADPSHNPKSITDIIHQFFN